MSIFAMASSITKWRYISTLEGMAHEIIFVDVFSFCSICLLITFIFISARPQEFSWLILFPKNPYSHWLHFWGYFHVLFIVFQKNNNASIWIWTRVLPFTRLTPMPARLYHKGEFFHHKISLMNPQGLSLQFEHDAHLLYAFLNFSGFLLLMNQHNIYVNFWHVGSFTFVLHKNAISKL